MFDFSLTLHVLDAITVVLNFVLAVYGCVSLLRKMKGVKPSAFRNRRR